MDLNYDNIQYSMGVANIMNKYNLSSTSDIKKYNNKNVSIKTKKKRDGKGVYNETLIFVQKKEAKRTLEFMKEQKEMLSSLATAGVQPTLYLLEDIEQDDVGEKIQFSNKTSKGKFNVDHDDNFLYKNAQSGKKMFKRDIFRLAEPSETNYTNMMFTDELLLTMKKEREYLQAGNMAASVKPISKNKEKEMESIRSKMNMSRSKYDHRASSTQWNPSLSKLAGTAKISSKMQQSGGRQEFEGSHADSHGDSFFVGSGNLAKHENYGRLQSLNLHEKIPKGVNGTLHGKGSKKTPDKGSPSTNLWSGLRAAKKSGKFLSTQTPMAKSFNRKDFSDNSGSGALFRGITQIGHEDSNPGTELDSSPELAIKWRTKSSSQWKGGKKTGTVYVSQEVTRNTHSKPDDRLLKTVLRKGLDKDQKEISPRF
jgi:hypothetical protein